MGPPIAEGPGTAKGIIDMTQVGHPKEYIVEYDLPTDFRRRRFYRRIKRYLHLNWLDEVGWSTGSVVVTENKKFAWYVWREARAVGGVAHIYEAVRLDTEP